MIWMDVTEATARREQSMWHDEGCVAPAGELLCGAGQEDGLAQGEALAEDVVNRGHERGVVCGPDVHAALVVDGQPRRLGAQCGCSVECRRKGR